MAQGFLRGHSQLQPAVKGFPLNTGQNRIQSQLPIGNAWPALRLRLCAAITHGSGSGPVVDGLFRAAKSITMYDNLGRVLVNHIPGIFFKYMNTYKNQLAPAFDNIAAATASYHADIVIPFSDKMRTMFRSNDTVFNTLGLNSITIELQMGSIADLLGTPGTDTVVFTVDVIPETNYGVWPAEKNPHLWVDFTMLSPHDPSAGTIMKVDRAADYVVKRLWLFTENSATVGTPFSGTGANTVIDTITVDTQKQLDFNAVPFTELQAINAEDYGITPITGLAVIDFIRDGSNYSAIMTDGSRFDITLVNKTLSTSQVMCVVEGLRVPALAKR